MNDLELLRTYEPVAYFTKGEIFYPIAVDEYIRESSLWLTNPQGKDTLLVPYGELSVERLIEFNDIPTDHKMHLRFVEHPLEGLNYQRWLHDPEREDFVAPSRLVRVPLIFRLADAGFNLSLLVRGQVPGGQAAAADQKNQAIVQRDGRRVYYGRVVRSGGWIALQYIFFYAMNNWRSGFYGINDHEADWEQVFVFLTDPRFGEPEPRWVAYASHDFRGDDLRRRWDDPKLMRQGNHPVIFIGAGSHASYFEPGEYLMGAEPEILQPFKRAADWMQKFWNDSLGMGSTQFAQRNVRAKLKVPFIDYARGDGLRIGPNQEETWSPVLISDEVEWVQNYRGLWGLDTHDPIGGERAPAGPKYNRRGTPRQSWYDPIGWAGLDKVFPPDLLPSEIEVRLTAIDKELEGVNAEIQTVRHYLRSHALDVEALKTTEYFSDVRKKQEEELRLTQARLHVLKARRAELKDVRLALETYGRRVDQHDLGTPTAHLRYVHHPEPPLPPQLRVVEIWVAFSGTMILLGIILLILFRPANWLLWLIGSGVALGAIDALTRGHLVNYLLNITIVLAVIATGILLFEFWVWVLVASLVAVVIFMIRENIRELRH